MRRLTETSSSPTGTATGSQVRTGRARWRWRVGLLSGVVVAVALVIGAATRAQDPAAAPPSPPPSAPPEDDGAETPAAGMPGPPKPPNANVRILFKIIPNGNATVTWGKKRLGVIKPKGSLAVQRPRDSGPLDVIVRSPGYIPVHTRAYTFTDTTVAVKLTPVDKKNTLYGYREEIPPEADGGAPNGGPDGGMP